MAANALPQLDGVTAIARAVYEHSREQGVALRPNAYAVLYGYLSGMDQALVNAVDAALAAETVLSDATIDALYRQFFTAQALEKGVSTISARLEGELDTLVRAVGRNVDHAGEYVGEVATISDRLEADAYQPASDALIQQLIDRSRSYVEEKQSLLSELSAVRDQVDAMRRELNVLQHEAYVDHLTQLNNRRFFDIALGDAIDAARADGETLCVAMADIDKFKIVNDTWGHAVGDKILKRFADLMRKNMRAGDTIARFGGEEFALIMPKIEAEASAQLVDQIREYLGSTRFVARASGQRLGRVTVSFGVTTLRADDDAASLLGRADALLYAAKNGGRNQVRTDA